jgi:hypothetical protein
MSAKVSTGRDEASGLEGRGVEGKGNHANAG